MMMNNVTIWKAVSHKVTSHVVQYAVRCGAKESRSQSLLGRPSHKIASSIAPNQKKVYIEYICKSIRVSTLISWAFWVDLCAVLG